MADEITVVAGLKVTNGNLVINVPTVTVKVDQATARGGGPGTLDIGTSEETVDFVDTVPGYVLMRNLDATNFVTYGLTTGQLGLTLPAGGAPTLLYVGTGSLILKADTATCKVQVVSANL